MNKTDIELTQIRIGVNLESSRLNEILDKEFTKLLKELNLHNSGFINPVGYMKALFCKQYLKTYYGES